jgi:hypothetical protein
MHLTPNISDVDGVLLDGLQFCTKVYELFESIRSSEGGKSRLRMRSTDIEKKLIEELLPIARYVQMKHGPGRSISLRWLSGDQQYDAEVLQSGDYVDLGRYPANGYIEVTGVMHPNDYLMRELLDTDGRAFGIEGVKRIKKTGEIKSIPVVRRNWEFIDSFSALVLDGITRKVNKNYPPNTTLIVHCSLNTVYTPDEWEELMNKIRTALPCHKFREIFVYDGVGDLFCSFHGPQLTI